MDDNHAKIRSIVEICSCNEGTALRLLQAARFDVEAAIERYFTEGPSFEGANSITGGGSSSMRSPPAQAASALKKPSEHSNWIEPFFPADAEQAAINARAAEGAAGGGGAADSGGARAPDARQVKFHESSLNGGGGAGQNDDAPSSYAEASRRSGILTSLDNFGEEEAQHEFIAPWMPASLSESQQQRSQDSKWDSEGRVKRARPDMPPDPSDPSSSAAFQPNAGKRQQSQENDPMQLDSSQPSGHPSAFDQRFHSTNPTGYESEEEAAAAAGWAADLPIPLASSSTSTAMIPYGPDNFPRNRRPPSPPPRRDGPSTRALTSGEDYDLERALQASLEDQRGGGAMEEDDPELAAAIQASMTDAGMMDSWYSTGSAGFGSKCGGKDGRREAGKVPDHLAPLKWKEVEKSPPALAAPFESLKLFPLILHALYALAPVRRGFQEFEIERLSGVNDMTFFWTGIPAGKKSNAPGLGKWVSAEEREKADVVQRLQILFLFMDRTLRPVCMTGSILEVLPQSLMTLNSGQPDPADLATYTIASFFDAYRTAVRAVAGRHSEDQEEWIAQKMRIFDTGVSYGTPELAPPLPAEGKAEGDEGNPAPALVIPTPQRNPLTTVNCTHLEVKHTEIVNDMPAGVLAVLEDDAALVTVPADTLCVGIKRDWPQAGGEAGGSAKEKGKGKGKGKDDAVGLTPWRIDKHFYADPFLWERRRGVPHGQGPEEADRMEELKNRREEVTKRVQKRTWLAAPAGKDALALMNDALAYFEGAGQATDDAIRTQTCQEAAAKLRKMRDSLQDQLNVLDEVIAAEEAKIATSHSQRIEKFRQEYEGKPEWQTVRYDLRAILMRSGEVAWAYVQHRGQWFRVQDGHLHPTDESTALTDEGGAHEPGGGVFFLAYVRSDAVTATGGIGLAGLDAEYEERKKLGLAEDAEMRTVGELMEHGVEGPVEPPEPFADAIDTDNEEFQAMLLSLRSTDSPSAERFDPTSAVAGSQSSPRKRKPNVDERMSLGLGVGVGGGGGGGGGGSVGGSGGGGGGGAFVDVSGLLKQEHEQRRGDGSPSSIVAEIDFRDEQQ
ncbi:hypothetical protein OC842_001027 [Tilletia horrida]|uniref:UBA domain-containing protein n=1 Tax=Tilletia horrida TaxID=155126 RepID=A0AAN6GKR5_9BASI|nr:hypothetical protein OC842_001027 [Tilletia horrida]